MTRLAAAELRKQGVPVTDATEIHISDLVATQVQDGGAKMLIGSAWAEVRGTGHRIFLIARVSEATSAIEMSAYHKTTGVLNENDDRRILFADQLDLDGDGTDELVLEITGYENEEFWIYKRQTGAWMRVWVGGQGSC